MISKNRSSRLVRSAVAILLLLGACGGKVIDQSGGLAQRGGTAAAAGGVRVQGGAAGSSTSAVGGTTVGPEGGCDGCICPNLFGELGADSSTAQCRPLMQTADSLQSNLLVVLDKSGSMPSAPTGYTKSKWAVVVDALKAGLSPTEVMVKFGLLLYPYSDSVTALTCELPEGELAVSVPVGPAAETVPAINALMASTTPGGGTPTAAALASAVAYYTRGAGASLVGDRYVLLITDGGPYCNSMLVCGPETCTANIDMSGSCGTGVPNCCDPSIQVAGRPSPTSLCLDDAAVMGQLSALRSAGITTFVVGLPGSEAYADYLDAFAVEGGAPLPDQEHLYYRVTAEAALLAVLTEITASTRRACVVPLEQSPPDLGTLNLAIDCEPLPQRSGDVINWSYDPNSLTITLQGPVCESLKTVGASRIDVLSGCAPTLVE